MPQNEGHEGSPHATISRRPPTGSGHAHRPGFPGPRLRAAGRTLARGDGRRRGVRLPTTSTRAVVEAVGVSRFIGKTLTVVQTVAWGPRTASGGRDGRLDIAVPGLPVTLTGAAALSGTDAETSIDYDGELTVNVPFVGRQIEEQAAPEITGVLNSQQAIGEEWLATH